MMRIIFCAILIMIISGCTADGRGFCLGDSCDVRNAVLKERALVRVELFRECMNLAALNPRKGDDDVSDLISECGTQSHYMANGLFP